MCSPYCLITDYSAYSVSKIGVNRLTELLAEKVTRDASPPRVLINTVSLHIVLYFHINACS